jgi:hypothetical protein
MLSKVCATWLVVLVLLPCTAPFSTFDPTELLSERSRGLGTPASQTAPAALTHAALSRAVPFPPRPAVRVRPTLTRSRAPYDVAPWAIGAAAPSSAAPIQVVHPPSRPTVLRI